MNIDRWNRRRFAAALGAATLAGSAPPLHAAEPPLETTRLRLSKVPSICLAPQYVAEALLRAEGFTQIEYIGEGNQGGGVPGAQRMGAGEFDLGMNFAGPLVVALDMGVPISLIGGVHAGCFELFASERVRTIKDLKGKTVAILNKGSAQHVFLSSIAASVGLDPMRDIEWVDRFYALRLREAGMVKGSPRKLIERGTDGRFLERLKKEMKT